MKDPAIKVKIIHSQSKPAWNIVGTKLGAKYKIARIPYVSGTDEITANNNRQEAFEHAEFIAYCFNHSESILNK